MEQSTQALFQISLKVLLRKGEKVLITIGDKGDIDLPGGRIDVGEENVPLEDIIAREIREELGEDVKFRLGAPLFVNRVGRVQEYGTWVLHVVFDAEYISGNIKLSDEHLSYEWVDRKTYQVLEKDFQPEDKEKYETFRQYFSKLQEK